MAPGARLVATLLVVALSSQIALGCWTGYVNNCGTKTLKCPWPTSAGYGVKHYPTDLTSCSGVQVTCSSNNVCGVKESTACGVCYIESGTNKVVLLCAATTSSVDRNWYWGSNNVKALVTNPVTSSCANPMLYAGNGICGDPHFAAPGGIFFDWHGKRDQSFSIISDSRFQLNGRFIGQRVDSDKIEPGTWMEELGMGYMTETSGDVHFVTVGVDQEKEHENADAFFFTFDGEDIAVGSGSKTYTWQSPDGMVTITREPHMRAQAHVKIEGLFEATFYTRVESRIQLEPLGKYLDLEMDNLQLTKHVHGVLGQMFRPDILERKARAAANATSHEALVDGTTADYRVSDVTAYDSAFNQFNHGAGVRVKSFKLVSDVSRAMRKMMSADVPVVAGADVTVSRLTCSQGAGRLVCA